MAVALLACGIDPNRSLLFKQSDVREHSELGWILGCITPLGWLERMTQFKSKEVKYKETSSLGLFSYPVLQAADILLYKASGVPVGEDQLQHLELSRKLAVAFNSKYKTSTFVPPMPLLTTGSCTRVMSLKDGMKKMSKSDIDGTRINLNDDADTIMQKIKRAKTGIYIENK